MKKLYFSLSLILTLTFSALAQQIPFQGRLLDNDRPFNGTATIDFSIASPSWSETKSGVPVVDGYYSVVLGSDTPLPENLFGDNREVTLSITVNSESLGSVTLHSPLLPYTAAGPVEIDSVYAQAVRLFNASDNPAAYFQAGTEGATLQISAPDVTDSYNRATFFAGTTGTGENAFANLYGLNPSSDGQELLINNYTTANNVFGSPFTGGYRRGGTDYFDNEGTFLAGIGSNRDESGGDPTGKSGLVIINGPTSRNIYASGQWWSNSELGIIQVFGQNDDGAGDWSSNVEIVADDQVGETSGRISMMNTANGGTINETILVSSNNGAGGGFMELRDNGGATTLNFDGQNGNIAANGDVSGNTLTSSDGMVQTSDRRLKKNIQDLDNPLEKVSQLRGVSYQWKDESKSQRSQIGVIAQEVEGLYPEFVFTNDKGMKAVNYAQMTAVLIEAIKELNLKVQTLESENSDLKASLEEVKTLRTQVDHLMNMLGTSKAASK